MGANREAGPCASWQRAATKQRYCELVRSAPILPLKWKADLRGHNMRVAAEMTPHNTKAETASKALNRLSIVMKHAAALGLSVDVQACEKAKALLGKSRHVPKHIPAMPWSDVPAFYDTLNDGTVTHLALRLLILTGVRSAAVRNCRVDQIESEVWTIPAEIMKGAKGHTSDFRVPLSQETQLVLRNAAGHSRNGLIFLGQQGRSPISDITLSQHMSRRGLVERPHGFRTSLRT